jgi:hypothetical protein
LLQLAERQRFTDFFAIAQERESQRIRLRGCAPVEELRQSEWRVAQSVGGQFGGI